MKIEKNERYHVCLECCKERLMSSAKIWIGSSVTHLCNDCLETLNDMIGVHLQKKREREYNEVVNA